MNTTEIVYNNNIKSFKELYKLAMKQFVHYEEVEGINWKEYDFSIDCAEDQMKFKDMLQIRCIEELTEASMAMEEPDEHFWEEIGDSMNFFLSAFCMLGVDMSKMSDPSKFLKKKSHKVKPSLETFSSISYVMVIERIGYLCNLLKNRPWTETNFLVSMTDFDGRLTELWESFWRFLGFMGLSSEDVFEIFYKKYKVNEFRRSTHY